MNVANAAESPSPPLRSCWALGQSYNQLPRDLFNAAFVSCWSELSQQHQNELVKSLQQALLVPDLPEITQVYSIGFNLLFSSRLDCWTNPNPDPSRYQL